MRKFDWDYDRIIEVLKPKTFRDCQKIAWGWNLTGKKYYELVFELFNKINQCGENGKIQIADSDLR